MKNIIKVVVLIVAMMASNANLYAQKVEQQRITREQLAETQAQFIANEMAMDDETTRQFVETFCQIKKEIWALGPRPKREKSHLSDKEAEQAMNERFAHSQKILDLRKKYYLKYSKFLTPTQIEKVYVLERRMMNRLFQRSQNKDKRK